MFSPNDLRYKKQYFNLMVSGKDTHTSLSLSTVVSSWRVPYGTNRNYLSHRHEPKAYSQVRGIERQDSWAHTLFFPGF